MTVVTSRLSSPRRWCASPVAPRCSTLRAAARIAGAHRVGTTYHRQQSGEIGRAPHVAASGRITGHRPSRERDRPARAPCAPGRVAGTEPSALSRKVGERIEARRARSTRRRACRASRPANARRCAIAVAASAIGSGAISAISSSFTCSKIEARAPRGDVRRAAAACATRPAARPASASAGRSRSDRESAAG